VPVRILDLANRMIRARGLRAGQDIAIKFVGTRPGEKLSEELISPAEEKRPTEHQAIFRIERTAPLDLSQLDHELDELVSFSLDGYTPDAIRARLRNWVEALQSSTMPPTAALPAQSEGERRSASDTPGAIQMRSEVWQTLG
jgi:FlaA1/EpsC-like NDP-sugar epimerase